MVGTPVFALAAGFVRTFSLGPPEPSSLLTATIARLSGYTLSGYQGLEQRKPVIIQRNNTHLPVSASNALYVCAHADDQQ
jgi:hypothetical protein